MTALSDQVRVLLEEAKDQPHIDTPRLVLADWLMDQGDPRGELMAVQLHLRGLAEDDPRRHELRRRERELLGRHVFDWLGPLADLASGWRFHRGLIRLEARADRLLSDACAELVAAGCFTWVEELHLTDLSVPHLSHPCLADLLGWVPCLDLADNLIGNNGLALLLGLPGLARLRALGLARTRIGQRGAASLASCAHLANLVVLDLSRNSLGDAGALAVAESPHLAGLRRLDLRGNSVNHAGIAALRARFGDRVRLGRRSDEAG
jgi:uncharacterized protein (TIGR02996 family)